MISQHKIREIEKWVQDSTSFSTRLSAQGRSYMELLLNEVRIDRMNAQSNSEDALQLSHIRNAFYEWRGGNITIADFHGVIEAVCAPSQFAAEGVGKK